MVYDNEGLPVSGRTRATEKMYQQAKQNGSLTGLANEPPIVKYDYWKLIQNRYPYDEHWCNSMMLVLDRKCEWSELIYDELRELHNLMGEYMKVFDKFEINGKGMSSVPSIPHVHLLQGVKQ